MNPITIVRNFILDYLDAYITLTRGREAALKYREARR